jgi:hypothetical protein
MEDIEILREIYQSKKSYKLQFAKYEQLRILLIESTKELIDAEYAERLYVLFNKNINNTCPGCGSLTKFQDVTHGYRKYCSNNCKRLFIYNDERTRKSKETCVKNYGVDNPRKSDVIQQKIAVTCNERYGCEYAINAKEVQQKRIDTWRIKYKKGTPEYDMWRNNVRNTCIERYGVDSNLKIPAVRIAINEKLSQKFYDREFGKYYDFTYPSGKMIRTQGYENIALYELIESYDENNIIASKRDIREYVGEIKYNDNGIERTYFPDIYIPSAHKIIEVKSEYTYELHLEQNIAKKEKCIKLGYSFEFWIYKNRKSNKIIA